MNEEEGVERIWRGKKNKEGSGEKCTRRGRRINKKEEKNIEKKEGGGEKCPRRGKELTIKKMRKEY